jgi:hypothetical protein
MDEDELQLWSVPLAPGTKSPWKVGQKFEVYRDPYGPYRVVGVTPTEIILERWSTPKRGSWRHRRSPLSG